MCVTFVWNHDWALVFLFVLLSISSVWAFNSPHMYVKAWDGPILELMLNRVCVCCCVNGGQVLRTIGLVGERLFFMAASCWEKDFLWLQGIVSFKYEFYCWKEASRDQRVGLIIPVFAVWASEGDHLSRVHSQRRDLLNHVQRSVPVTWETDDTHINTGKDTHM